MYIYMHGVDRETSYQHITTWVVGQGHSNGGKEKKFYLLECSNLNAYILDKFVVQLSILQLEGRREICCNSWKTYMNSWLGVFPHMEARSTS